MEFTGDVSNTCQSTGLVPEVGLQDDSLFESKLNQCFDSMQKRLKSAMGNLDAPHYHTPCLPQQVRGLMPLNSLVLAEFLRC